jgi:hypothetical protein
MAARPTSGAAPGGVGAADPSGIAARDRALRARWVEDLLAPPPSPRARPALLEILDVLRVGVFGADGKVVQSGDERSPHDGYLYGFEVDLLAADAASPPTRTAGDLSGVLGNMLGLPPDDPSVSAAAVADFLTGGVRAAGAAPEDPDSMLPLLVRDLVLARTGVDVTNPFDPSESVLNRLTFWLVVADVAFSLLRRIDPADLRPRGDLFEAPNGSPRRGPVRTEVTTRSISILDLCESIGTAGGREVWTGFGKWAATLVKGIAEPVKLMLVITDGVHGSVLAFSVAIETESEKVGPVHLGHGQTGAPVDLRARVVMRDHLSEIDIKCGWLFGVVYPKQGGMSGVGVSLFGAESDLARYGTAECLAKCYTDADGWVTVRFVPKAEEEPSGAGMLVEESYVLNFAGRYQAAQKNYLGQPAQWMKMASTRLFVEWHTPGVQLHYSATVTQTFRDHKETPKSVDDTLIVVDAAVEARFGLALVPPVGEGSVSYPGNGELAYEHASLRITHSGYGPPVDMPRAVCGHNEMTTITGYRPGQLVVDLLMLAEQPDGTVWPQSLALSVKGISEHYHSSGYLMNGPCPSGPPSDYDDALFTGLFEAVHPSGLVTDWGGATATDGGRTITFVRTHDLRRALSFTESITLQGLPVQ